MSEFAQKKCPTCGGRLELIVSPQTGGASRRQYECRCCHNVYELERNESLFEALQVASIFRESLNFAQAEIAYKNIISKFRDEDLSDVYWNLFLCEQRVVFEMDQRGEQFPSFYSIVPERIEDSNSYFNALKYAKAYDKVKYYRFIALAEKMSEAKNKYATINQTTKPYDIFICFKKAPLDGRGVTRDYGLAYELYNKFSRDYNVFFSERSLDNIVVREYEPNIYHALYTAKIMLVLCSKREYLESQWVKNEWSRFKAMTKTMAQAKSIIPIFIDDFTPEHLPEELRSCQGYKADIGLSEKLTNVIGTILGTASKENTTKGKSSFAGVKDAAKNLGSELMTVIGSKLNEGIEEVRKRLVPQDVQEQQPQQVYQQPAYQAPPTPHSKEVGTKKKKKRGVAILIAVSIVVAGCIAAALVFVLRHLLASIMVA